jgi:hypothetical protein
LFEYFPQAAADASSFILGHLDHFSVEMLRNEIITNIIPGLVRELEQDGGGIFEEDSEEHILLSHYTIKPPSYTTVLRWVHYESMKKILKSHRAALDFDRAFVVTSIKTCDVEIDWQKELGGGEEMTNKKRKITK